MAKLEDLLCWFQDPGFIRTHDFPGHPEYLSMMGLISGDRFVACKRETYAINKVRVDYVWLKWELNGDIEYLPFFKPFAFEEFVTSSSEPLDESLID